MTGWCLKIAGLVLLAASAAAAGNPGAADSDLMLGPIQTYDTEREAQAACGPDGVRCDVDGNVWVSSNAGRNVGYSGVTVWNPAGALIGRIRIPEVVGNLTFGGPKRNRLFMAGSQSLYAVHVNTQGAAPG